MSVSLSSGSANGVTTTAESKFHAAVNVIQNLPKNGSYKPTPRMMLKFYSYYKQATEGPCRKPKPWSWDVINKAKWEAWSKLDDMPKEQAMNEYVENLKLVMTEAPPISDEQIGEAIPATDNVQGFIKVLGSFYEAVDLEPPSQLKKFSHVTTSTPVKNDSTLRDTVSAESQLDSSKLLSGEEEDRCNDGAMLNQETSANEPVDEISEDNQSSGGDESEDEFCDTAEDIQVQPSESTEKSDPLHSQNASRIRSGADSFAQHESGTLSSTPNVMNQSFGGQRDLNGHNKVDVPVSNNYNNTKQETVGGYPTQSPSGLRNSSHSNMQVKSQISVCVAQLQQDMDRVLNRLSLLEALKVQREGHHSPVIARDQHGYARMWPFTELSPKTIFFILSWPFAVVWFLNSIRRRRLER